MVVLAAVGSLWTAASAAAADAPPSFTRDIKGILSNRCVRCHGPDPEGRAGGGDEGLRLDTFAGATADLGGHAAIVPGKPDESELIARITSTDPDVVMPPPDAGEPLPDKQVDLLRRWIAAGATYEPHWAYVPPKRPAVPAVKNAAWPKNDIDRFILARLEAEGLAPQPEADRATLARRLALDLTGLPLSPDEVDEFTVRQLAGDLLPEATLDDKVATAFHRNTLTNNEGGTIDEEFRTVAIIDRVNTTMSTWMGTTMACAQCHDHKYDPLSQKEYFQLYAILNNTADADRRDESPLVEIPWADVDAKRVAIEREIAAIEQGIPQLAQPAPKDRPEPPEFQPARPTSWPVIPRIA